MFCGLKFFLEIVNILFSKLERREATRLALSSEVCISDGVGVQWCHPAQLERLQQIPLNMFSCSMMN